VKHSRRGHSFEALDELLWAIAKSFLRGTSRSSLVARVHAWTGAVPWQCTRAPAGGGEGGPGARRQSEQLAEVGAEDDVRQWVWVVLCVVLDVNEQRQASFMIQKTPSPEWKERFRFRVLNFPDHWLDVAVMDWNLRLSVLCRGALAASTTLTTPLPRSAAAPQPSTGARWRRSTSSTGKGRSDGGVRGRLYWDGKGDEARAQLRVRACGVRRLSHAGGDGGEPDLTGPAPAPAMRVAAATTRPSVQRRERPRAQENEDEERPRRPRRPLAMRCSPRDHRAGAAAAAQARRPRRRTPSAPGPAASPIVQRPTTSG
jgi:hypothetical protein